MDPLLNARDLLKGGRFLDALKALDSSRSANRTAVATLRVQVLERLGRHDESRQLTNWLLKSKQLTDVEKAICCYVDGSLLFEEGDAIDAVAQLQRSIELARKACQLDLVCLVQTKLVSVVTDLSGPDAVSPIVSELRQSIASLGDQTRMVEVHLMVAERDACRGLFGTARSHLRVASGLLQ